MLRLFVFTVFLLCLFGCGEGTRQASNFTTSEIESLHLDSTKLLCADVSAVKRVNLNSFLGDKEFEFGDKVQSLHFIPLETTDDGLLANIYKVVLTDDYIYVHDAFKGGGLAIFTSKGKFVRRISHGGGPGELYRLSDLAFDSVTNRLLAYQHPFLLFYTPDGKYLEQKKIPFGFYNFYPMPGGYVFKTIDGMGNQHLGSKQPCTFLVTDTTFRLRQAALPVPADKTHFGGYCYLYGSGGNIQVTGKFNDTIYSYNPLRHALHAAYVLDYSDKKLPDSYVEDPRGRFTDILTQNDYYYFLGEYLETTSHQAFFLRNDWRGHRLVVYRDKHTGGMSGGATYHFDYHLLPPVGFPKATYKDCFVSLHYPSPQDSCLQASSLISAEDKRVIAGLTTDDNPVLVLFRMKSIEAHE